jgi:protein-tyrosine phosphatase
MSNSAVKTKVLFVCMGNICRSPTAEGVFRHKIEMAGMNDRVEIDSAGTHAYHVGEPPDQRAQAAALQRGFDLSSQRARRVRASDFTEFDYVLAMDRPNLDDLLAICPDDCQDRVQLFLNFAEQSPTREVPDPYYGGGNGFETVLDLVEAASEGLLVHIQQK